MRRISNRAGPIVGAFVLVLTGCSTAVGTRDDSLRSKIVQGSSGTLTRTELLSVASGRSLYDAVSLLRPNFLHGRYEQPTVAINGMLVGNASFLSTMQPGEVESIQLLDGLDATTRFGARHNGAVLLVTTRPR